MRLHRIYALTRGNRALVMFFGILTAAQTLLGISFIASPDNTGMGLQLHLPARAVAGTDWNFMIFIVSCSIRAPGYQARSLLHLHVRFGHSDGISLRVAVAGL